jgi:hypothetical protein
MLDMKLISEYLIRRKEQLSLALSTSDSDKISYLQGRCDELMNVLYLLDIIPIWEK